MHAQAKRVYERNGRSGTQAGKRSPAGQCDHVRSPINFKGLHFRKQSSQATTQSANLALAGHADARCQYPAGFNGGERAISQR